jgi:hypothetical protein
VPKHPKRKTSPPTLSAGDNKDSLIFSSSLVFVKIRVIKKVLVENILPFIA